MTNQSTAFQVGQIVGMLIALGFIIGMIGLAIFLIVRAFQKKTTGWIIGGVIGGLILTVPAVALAAAFVTGFAKGLKEARSKSGGYDQRTSVTQKIEGLDVAYSIEVPAGWSLKRNSESFDLMAHQKSVYVGVIAEELSLESPQNVADFARKHLREVGTEIELTDSLPIIIDGREWLQFTVSCRIQGIPLGYQYFVYAGEEGTFQLIGWTSKELFDRDLNRMREVMQTFRFPVKKDSPGQ